MSLAAITSKALPVLQLNFLISVHFFNTGVHLAFFVTEVSDCEHACWRPIAPQREDYGDGHLWSNFLQTVFIDSKPVLARNAPV